MSEVTREIWQKFNQRLANYITARVAVPEDAEDLLQEAFLRFHRAPPPPESNHSGWVFAVVRNLIADYYRRRKSTASPDHNLPERERFEVTETEQTVAGWLEALIEGLPPKYGEAVLLADLRGQSMKQVAQKLGLSVPGAKSRVQRGRIMLAEALDSCCELYFDQAGRVDGWRKRNVCDC